MNSIITIALCTRLRRKVFQITGSQEKVSEVLYAKAPQYGIEIIKLYFLDYGLIVELNNPDSLSTSDVAFFLRTSTSGLLRSAYPALSKMPSLWIRNYFCKNGYLTYDVWQETASFYENQKRR